MEYTRRLPTIGDIVRLSMRVTRYPATRADIVRVARMWQFSDNVVMLLRQFPVDELFSTRVNLVTRCNNLMSVIREQREKAVKIQAY